MQQTNIFSVDETSRLSLWTKMIPAIPKPGISCNYLMYSTASELEGYVLTE